MIRKKRKLTLGLLLAFTISTILSGCATFDNFKEGTLSQAQEADKQNETVKIGVFQPLSGEYKEYGELEKRGIELAHKLYPEVLGKKVELVYGDNKSDDDVAATVAQQLVNKKVSVVLGSYGSHLSLVGGDYFDEAKIPAIAISSRNPLVTKGNEYYFRVSYLESFQGIALAKYAFEGLEASKVAILQDIDDDHMAPVVEAFSEKFALLTEDEEAILKTEQYKSGQTDFKRHLSSIKNTNAEVVLLACCNATDAATIIKQAKELEMDATFLGVHEWEVPEFIQEGGKAVEDVKFTTLFDPEAEPTEMRQRFLSEYKKEYGQDAVPDSSVALGFDAYLVAIDSIKRAGTSINTTAIKEEMAKIRDFAGASGNISFDLNGDPVKSVIIKTITNGEFVYTYTVEPVWE